jgi:hypothetical protein
MTNGDRELAITFCKKTLDMIPKDEQANKEFLEQIRAGALEKLKKLETK